MILDDTVLARVSRVLVLGDPGSSTTRCWLCTGGWPSSALFLSAMCQVTAPGFWLRFPGSGCSGPPLDKIVRRYLRDC